MTNQKFIKFAFLPGLIILSSFIFSACGGSSAKNANANANANTQPTVVDVTTTGAIVKNVPVYFEATGNLASDAQTDVAPSVGGKIAQVNFDVGSYVTQGSVLVKLDDRDARIRLDQAQAQVVQAQQNVRQAQANVDAAIATLRQTQARLGVSDNETFNIETFSQVRSITAQLELAEQEFKRAEKLFDSGDIPRNAYDQRRSQRDSLLGQLSEARSNAAVAVKAIDTARAQVKTAQTVVGINQAAVATAQTQVDQAQKAITDTVIYSPLSGYVSERVADVGEYISPSAPNTKIATIVRTSILRLKIDVPEQNIGLVKVGQGISLQTSAYPDRNFAGTIVRILPSLNATSRTLTVEAEVQNSDGLLKPGQFATVRIAQSEAKPTIMIPTGAVKTEGETNKVFVVKDGRAQERIVKLGVLENNLIEVQNGVQENEQVVVSGVNQVYDGVTVRQ